MRQARTGFPKQIAALTLLCGWLAVAAVHAQSGVQIVGPAPIPPAAARQKFKALLENLNPGNRQQSLTTIFGLVKWYRDILDDELIAAWQKDSRANLPDVMEQLADARVASSIVSYSWRQQRAATFRPDYAPMLGSLMARYPDSAKPFLDDLLGRSSAGAAELSQPEAEAVCRILLDMPDLGGWRQNALQVLPRYRPEAQSLLTQDLHGDDQEKSYRASRWIADLGWRNSMSGAPRSDGPGLSRRPGPGTTPPPASSTEPRAGVVLTPLDPVAIDNAAAARASTTPAIIEFVNHSRTPVDIYWINPQGARVLLYGSLPVGGTVEGNTFLTHPFLVVVSGSGGTERQGTGTLVAGFEPVTPNRNRDRAKRDTAVITGPVAAEN